MMDLSREAFERNLVRTGISLSACCRKAGIDKSVGSNFKTGKRKTLYETRVKLNTALRELWKEKKEQLRKGINYDVKYSLNYSLNYNDSATAYGTARYDGIVK